MKSTYRFGTDIAILAQEWVPANYIEPFHWHAALEIGYCLSGSGAFYFSDKVFPVEPGDVFVVNNLERHIAQSNPLNPSNFVFIYFDASLIEAVDPQLLVPFVYFPARFQNKIPAQTETAKQIGRLAMQIRDELSARHCAYCPLALSLLVQICALLVRNYRPDATCAQVYRSQVLYNKIQPALKYMKSHFQEPISLTDVARHISLSPSRTRHLFTEILGESFKDYLLQLRVNEAKKLLIGTEYTIAEVCMESGFQSVASFYRAFGQTAGMSPLAYREQMTPSRLQKEG